jgi:predicted FMN-binding regulatory protein PaiB
VIHYDYYSDIPDDLIDAFVREQELGRLLTVGDDGLPHLGLYPFAYDGAAIEIHLNSADDQFAHLEARARCAFEFDEVLATVPSYWVDPESAVAATAYHRTVLFECERVMISRDPAVLIAAVRLSVVARKVKWKIGQNRAPEQRARVVAELRRRGRPRDARAADALQWTIDKGR